MLKKCVYILAVIVLFLGVLYLISPKPNVNLYEPGAYCPFCDPKVLERQKFYEDDLVLALYTHKPVAPGHCLIISKRHVPRYEMLTNEEACRISIVTKMVNTAVVEAFGTCPYLLLQKNGYEVGQSVPHVHVHYIPQKSGASFYPFIFKLFTADMKKPISEAEMQENVEKLKEEIPRSA